MLSVGALNGISGVGLPTLVSESALGAVDMVQEGETGAGSDGLIAPRRLPNPYLESPQRMDLHRELLFNQRIGKNVLNQKSELQKALSKHKEKQLMNQVKEHRETPELERAIAERARRLEQGESSTEEIEPGTNPTLQEVRARLRHAAPPSSATSAH
ncbi:protein FAM107B isoform X2 [Galleria mellonella]|uniref:Protein FAM107B isoform X2 n=1 Tax=Galleria mellonella TaxID=7137 RepID=A0ABM3MH25_GALME|nr:protein FAM107B isoform X2 [Galleria mellonella]